MIVLKRFRTFLVSQDGPTSVEYGVLLALIVITVIAAITLLGTKSRETFEDVTNRMDP